MDDTISRQAVIDEINKYILSFDAIDANFLDGLKTSIKLIKENFPFSEPERKKGEWVWLSSTYDRIPCEMRFECSECHHETIVHTSGTSYPWEHYCPNCGAEMVKG